MIYTLKNIPSDTDLNTITTPGEYGSNTDTIIATLKNLPYTINSDNAIELFRLSVSEDIASGCIKQTLFAQNGKVWYRYIFGMAIGDWYEFDASEEKSTKEHNKTNGEKDSNGSEYKLKVMDTKKWSIFYNRILNY